MGVSQEDLVRAGGVAPVRSSSAAAKARGVAFAKGCVIYEARASQAEVMATTWPKARCRFISVEPETAAIDEGVLAGPSFCDCRGRLFRFLFPIVRIAISC